MKSMKTIVAMILAVAMLMGLMSTALADENTIKIAVIGPFTGPAANYGLACRYGAQVAADEINAQGGLQIELIFEDDEHDTEKAINAYNAVIEAGAQMIDGNTTTAPALAVGAVAYEERMFMLTPSASSDLVVADKDNFYQVCFQDPQMGTISANLITENKMGEKVAVIYNNADDYSTGIYNTFMAQAEANGLEVVSVTTFTDDTTDFSVQVASAKDAGADLVFLPIYYTPASMILQTAKTMDYAPVFFGVDGMDGILTMEGFDASLAEGVFMLTPFSADAEDEATKAFVARYQEITGEIPNQFAADCYDAVNALYTASLNAGITGETSPEDACEMLIEQFKTLHVDGLTGSMSWDETGAVTKTPTAVIIKDGAYVGFNG